MAVSTSITTETERQARNPQSLNRPHNLSKLLHRHRWHPSPRHHERPDKARLRMAL